MKSTFGLSGNSVFDKALTTILMNNQMIQRSVIAKLKSIANKFQEIPMEGQNLTSNMLLKIDFTVLLNYVKKYELNFDKRFTPSGNTDDRLYRKQAFWNLHGSHS